MYITIQRYQKDNPQKSKKVEYMIPVTNKMLSWVFRYIKTNIDKSFSYSIGCASEICGTCAVRVNGKEVLACGYIPNNGDVIEPLNYVEVVRDLKVDLDGVIRKIELPKAYLDKLSTIKQKADDIEKTKVQSRCILCSSCYSSCPVFEVNKDFLGPFVLTKVYKYYLDKRENNKMEKLELIQDNGIWDCTLCGNCAVVCPQGIMPDMDIKNLQMLSVQNGFPNKSFETSGDDFLQTDFGFNPN
jgi:fumarate reductase iron-sulfur subunit